MTYSNFKIFTVEVIGTFILVIFATGSIVYDAKIGGLYGTWFAALAPFIALIIGIYSFGRISLAHFNPAVTIGFYITGHISKIQIIWYFAAEIIGALLGSFIIMLLIGNYADLGTNAPNFDYPLILIFFVEVVASGLLMAVIFTVVYTNGLRGLGGIVIGGIVAFDIFFLSFISGASMNPARSLAPALLSGALENLWLYWTAPYIGTTAMAFLFRKRFFKQRNSISK